MVLAYVHCSTVNRVLALFYFGLRPEVRVMKKKDLEKAAGISNYVISKMNKGENITVDIVGKICSALNCTPNDIMEFSYDSI